MTDSSTQTGNSSSSLASVVESVTSAASVDVSTAASNQDSVAEVARQVYLCCRVCSMNDYRELPG